MVCGHPLLNIYNLYEIGVVMRAKKETVQSFLLLFSLKIAVVNVSFL